MNTKLKIASVLTMSIISTLGASGGNPSQSVPDFAFPKKVTQTSESNLKKSIADGNYPETVRSVLNYGLAQGAIGQDKMPGALKLVDNTLHQVKAPAAKSMLYLVKATMLSEIYNNDKYIYNNRILPLTPLPADYTEWSGEQFRSVISQLCDSAMTNTAELQSTPLRDYYAVVEHDEQTPIYFPTLYDFVAYRTIDIRSQLSEFSNMFTPVFLAPSRIFIMQPHFVPASREATKLLDTYAALLKFHEGHPAPEIYADLERLEFVREGVYGMAVESGVKTMTESLMELYDKNSQSEYSGNILIFFNEHVTTTPGSDNSTWLYDKLQHNISAFPSFHRIDCLKTAAAGISQPNVRTKHNLSIYPGKEFNVQLTSVNTKTTDVALYRVPDTTNPNQGYTGPLSALKLIAKKSVSTDKQVPFLSVDTLSFTAPQPGYYIIVPTSPQIKEERRNGGYNVIHCSELAAGGVSLNKAAVYVVNPMTGAPVDNAKITEITNRTPQKLLGLTDKEGMLELSDTRYVTIQPRKGTDIYATTLYVYGSDGVAMNGDTAVNAFTELPLYHPGDSVRFSAIAYRYEGNRQQVLGGKSVTANLFDVNNTLVDALTLSTDDFGRINGSFIIPEGTLTGDYYISFCMGTEKAKNRWRNIVGNISFMVSDYKMPTFEVTADKPLTDTPATGDVTLRGCVRTYSGMPLANQRVSLTLGVAQGLWWRMSNRVDFYTDSVTTDEQGRWEIILKKELLDNSPAPNGYFSATVTSTSPSGESQSTRLDFTRSAKYAITASINGDIDVSYPVKLNAIVTNSAGETVDMPICYTLSKDDTVVAQGKAGKEEKLDWKKLAGARYQLNLYLEQDTTVTYQTEVILYTPNDDCSPVNQPLWIPQSVGDILTDGETADLLYGTYAEKTHILVILSTPETVLEKRWIEVSKGMHRLNVKLPHDVTEMDVTLMATVDMKSTTLTRKVKRESSLRKLNIIAETFRNKILPGTTETWSFRTTNIKDKGEQAAVIFNLYNSALNALQSPNWHLYPRSGYMRSLNTNTPRLGSTCIRTIEPETKFFGCPDLLAPEFNLYNRSFLESREVVELLYGSVSPTSMKLKMNDEAKEAMMIRGTAATRNMAAGSVANVEKTEDALEEVAADGGAEPGDNNNQPEFAYRQSNVACGAWMPSLTSDADGNLSVSFTVPNANTTWQLFVTAFDRELTHTTLSSLVLANKPVMVQPNLPRFLRSGDNAVLKSLVINNTDSVADVLTTVEIFNPLTNEITSTHHQTLTIAPQQNGTVEIKITAPVDNTMIGFRVKCAANGFADGEQSIIPVLPASQPVVESKPFYIAPDSTSYSVKLPAIPQDARVTLQYCNNPLWYVVTALPGIAEAQPSSAINAAYNIFSATVARGILKDNPEIEKALKYWSSSECSDSTLVSMLERNADLKTVLLQATPWLTDAKNDTERMTRLALLLDNKNIEATIASGIAYLKKVQRGQGFAWMTQCTEASEWATSEVLACLGRANQLGYLPESKELKSMVNSALRYVQSENEKRYAKYPKSDFFAYVSMIDLWPEFKRSATSTTITNATVQRTVKGWKKFTVGHKAEAVILLMNHSYKTVAGTILASLREYSEYKPQQGMWWPSVSDTYGGSMAQLQTTADALEAFHAAESASKDVDRIRQWLILQKEAENWGSSAFTTDVISSILLTSKSWTSPAGNVKMQLDDAPLTLPQADRFTGYFRTPLTGQSLSQATLTIDREGDAPAFGAIFCQYIDNMADIKPQSCEAVSIEKHYYLHSGTGVVSPDSLKIGDKVQITLTIHAEKDMQYVAITDNRAACFEPVEQMPKPIFSEGICFYRENRDNATNLFVTNLPKGTYQLTYDMWVNNAGEFASGIATLQSQYAPQLTAHSAGTLIKVAQ